MNDSSFGSAGLKNRSINVNANLLSEWIAEQARLRREVVRYAALLGGALVLVVTAMPPLLSAASTEAGHGADLRRQIASFDASLKTADRARQAAQPALVVKTMCDRTTGSFGRFLGQLNRALGAGNARTAISSMRLDITGGEAHLVVVADAEEDGAADAYARNVSEEGAKVDAITSSHPSTLLAAQGIGFTYEKRIGVSQ